MYHFNNIQRSKLPAASSPSSTMTRAPQPSTSIPHVPVGPPRRNQSPVVSSRTSHQTQVRIIEVIRMQAGLTPAQGERLVCSFGAARSMRSRTSHFMERAGAPPTICRRHYRNITDQRLPEADARPSSGTRGKRGGHHPGKGPPRLSKTF